MGQRFSVTCSSRNLLIKGIYRNRQTDMITQSSSKQHKLDEAAREIEKCRTCKKDSSGRAVPGEGNPDAKVMFLGEAPGKTEAKTGRPFVDRSGQLLRGLIAKSGLESSPF